MRNPKFWIALAAVLLLAKMAAVTSAHNDAINALSDERGNSVDCFPDARPDLPGFQLKDLTPCECGKPAKTYDGQPTMCGKL